MAVETLYPMIINGRKIRTARHIDVINPATGAVFASAARADEAVLDAAVVAKPAATTPLSTCLLGEIWNEFLPPGVFNVICDDNDLGVGDGLDPATTMINEHMVFDLHVTARGAKLSGLGGELGPEGFNSYTQGYVVYQTSGH